MRTLPLCIALASWPVSAGCRSDDVAPEAEPAHADAGGSAREDIADAEDPTQSVHWNEALHAAVARGVAPPQMDDATYRVDAFVATLVFEHVRRTQGRPELTRYTPPEDQVQPGPGYRVGSLESDSIYATLGLREGDVIESINGVSLAEPGKLGFALDGAEHRVTATVFREDVSFTISYRLVGGLAWREALAGYTGEPEPEPELEPRRAGAAMEPPAEPEPSGTDTPAPEPADRGKSRPRPASGGGSSPRSKGPAKPSTPEKPSSPSPRPSTPSPVQCASSTRCTIEETYFQELVAVPSRMQSQVDVVPAISNDVFSGYKIKRVQPGSAASRLGFRPDDKVTHINGKDLTDDVQALQVYLGLSATKVFKIRYERSGRPQVKTVTVQ